MRSKILTLFAALSLGACTTIATPMTGAPGVVSAADARAAEAGASMLRKGGSATDAALATLLALTVVEPQSSGIGGGGFLVTSASPVITRTMPGFFSAKARSPLRSYLSTQSCWRRTMKKKRRTSPMRCWVCSACARFRITTQKPRPARSRQSHHEDTKDTKTF